jgi:hypothetical protein
MPRGVLQQKTGATRNSDMKTRHPTPDPVWGIRAWIGDSRTLPNDNRPLAFPER